MYIKFCNFGPYADVKVPPDSKEELNTDVYRRVRLYKRISAVFIVFSLFLLAVVLSLAMELYEVQSHQNCPVSDDAEELNCSRQLCQIMYPSTTADQNQVSEVQSSQMCQDLIAEMREMKKMHSYTSNQGCQCSECRQGWIKFENSCYFISKQRLQWQKSREACQKQGGDLVVINNERLQKFLTENWRMLYWIGLHNSEKKQWMWINNTAPTQSYWIQGQPNPDTQGSCALLNGGTPDLNNWLSNPCEVYSHFICQRG
ncbi:CD209 antigen-like protein C [Tachysurus fulvidraco]|uniref:CD209 antigen-like protein C n=1 Tax=Tachysurus fulvidraco TaxID=1234273 RepID=UPI000F4FAE99|nr:CD209 antigen-like protein C [Tachysurus fulvidraco]